ncbi:hypothetical protein CspHIS471_0503740 [Cutaneotrichosporon sp. HIS471]|nr:hypothetical protein CspHIS471_0503740 [Cutaneotrichosporon sp. HIS471]
MTDDLPTDRLKSIDVTPAEATVYIPTPLHPKSEALAEKTFGRVLRPGVNGWTREACIKAADVALIRVGPMNGDDIRSARRLKIIARNGTGYDAIDTAACRDTGVVVTNMPGGNASSVAELTLALALAVLRRVTDIWPRIRAGERIPSIQALSPGLSGKTVGIVGMGNIAYLSAKLFLAFNCRILVYSPSSPAERWTAGDPTFEAIPFTRVASLDDLLSQSDVVSLHCPLTPSTKNMIGAPQLARMKDGAVLINTSRGGMVDEEALADALEREGGVWGAGLDVMATEPAYGENLGRLRDAPNVVILPHLGGSTDQTTQRGCDAAIGIVVDYLGGKGARNRVV